MTTELTCWYQRAFTLDWHQIVRQRRSLYALFNGTYNILNTKENVTLRRSRNYFSATGKIDFTLRFLNHPILEHVSNKYDLSWVTTATFHPKPLTKTYNQPNATHWDTHWCRLRLWRKEVQLFSSSASWRFSCSRCRPRTCCLPPTSIVSSQMV